MAHPEIADLITDSTDELVRVWVQAVRADEGIRSDADLTEGGLIDHVPVMIEEVSEALRTGRRPTAENICEARVHSYTRFRQGYRARDLVRESSHLRRILLDHVYEKLGGAARPSSSLAAYHEAARVINLYLDEEMCYGVSIYTEELTALQN
ncbi:MAG: RsbRD N-terminal domain-containing protein [Acidobacteria bacterium]|nr:RsbRD N-terminal domain-containing protein [Acidobacteriota bacterium]